MDTSSALQTRGLVTTVACKSLIMEIYFQNDLTFVMRSNVSMFADDHQVYEIDKNVSNIGTKLQASAQKATSWYESNSLKGNHGKYGSMFISRANKLKDYKLKLNVNGTDIKAYDSITLLGVDIDNAL